MATVEDTDTKFISGDYLDLGDVHTHGDEEFYECVDADEMDNEYFDTQDFQDNELPSLVPPRSCSNGHSARGLNASLCL